MYLLISVALVKHMWISNGQCFSRISEQKRPTFIIFQPVLLVSSWTHQYINEKCRNVGLWESVRPGVRAHTVRFTWDWACNLLVSLKETRTQRLQENLVNCTTIYESRICLSEWSHRKKTKDFKKCRRKMSEKHYILSQNTDENLFATI